MPRRATLTIIPFESEPPRQGKFANDPHVWAEKTEPIPREYYRTLLCGTRKLEHEGDAGVKGNWWGRQRERWVK